jgi:hypothetical protein
LDLYYPLSYSAGTVATTEINTSRIRHFLDTIAGERLLFPDFGVPLTSLYTNYPQLISEQLRLLIASQLNIEAQIDSSYTGGVLTVNVHLAEEVVSINVLS